jgi:hypothetical protein
MLLSLWGTMPDLILHVYENALLKCTFRFGCRDVSGVGDRSGCLNVDLTSAFVFVMILHSNGVPPSNRLGPHSVP